jgi:tyrosyl-tRNA synthetase
MRLESAEGLDAASFLYQSLQAYDFLHLYQTKKCQLQVISFPSLNLPFQVGGSDQWGNITAGIELCQKSEISKTEGKGSFLLIYKSLTRSGGSRPHRSIAAFANWRKIGQISWKCIVP